MSSKRIYLMQNESAGFVGNSPLFWPDSNCGYTDDLEKAKWFTPAEARSLIRSTRGSHRWKRWPLRDVLKASRLVCDIQVLRQLAEKRKPVAKV